MFDELYPEERDTSINQQLYRPAPQPESPGFTKGLGSALADVLPYARYSIDSAWQGIYDVGKKAAEVYDTASMAKPPTLRGDIIGEVGRSPAALDYRNQAKQYEPDPAAVGIAGQIVHGLGSTIAKAGIYSLAGPAAPALFGADLGVNRTQELMDKGVDAETAVNSGAVSGVAGAAMLKIPPSVGATRTQSAVVGAVINPALNVGEIGGIHAILQHADYENIAAQYKPFDPLNLTIAALTGGLFGAAFHSAKPTLTPDEHAAALTMNEAVTRNNDGLTPAGDVHAANLATDAQIAARQQLDAGEPVSVADGLSVDHVRLAQEQSKIADAVEIHHAIYSMANDLHEGGGVAYTYDEHGTITGRTPSLNPEWFKDGNFKIQGRNGEYLETTPTVKEVKTAVSAHENGEKLTDRQTRIVKSLSDLAHAEEEFHNERYSQEESDWMRDLNDQINYGELSLDDLHNDNYFDTHFEPERTESFYGEEAHQELERYFGESEPATSTETGVNRSAEEVTPEAQQAARILARNPEALVRNEAGEDVPISELMSDAAAHDEAAKTETTMMQAAITCALSFGDSF